MVGCWYHYLHSYEFTSTSKINLIIVPQLNKDNLVCHKTANS